MGVFGLVYFSFRFILFWENALLLEKVEERIYYTNNKCPLGKKALYSFRKTEIRVIGLKQLPIWKKL